MYKVSKSNDNYAIWHIFPYEFFLKNKKVQVDFIIFIENDGFNWFFDAILVFFLEMEIFSFPKKCWIKCISKKFTTTGSANSCILDQVIF